MRSSRSGNLSQIKIFHLIPSLEIGGTEKSLVLLLSRLDQSRFKSVVCAITPGMPLANDIESLGIKVVSLNAQSRYDPRVPLNLLRLLQSEKPNILHTYLFHSNILGRLVGKLSRVPAILNSERAIGQDAAHRIALNRLTSCLATRIETNSKAGERYLNSVVGIDKTKISIVHSGVEIQADDVQQVREKTRRTLGISTNSPLIGYIGRLHPVKGVHILQDAFATVSQQVPTAQLLIVGDGEQRQDLENQARLQNQHNQIHFLGMSGNVGQFLAAIDILVLPSLAEGFPRIVLEAMASSKPVVATDVGGVSEAVIDQHTGLLVPPNNPSAIASALLWLIQNQEIASRMGNEGRTSIESYFNLSGWVSRYEDIYAQLSNQIPSE